MGLVTPQHADIGSAVWRLSFNITAAFIKMAFGDKMPAPPTGALEALCFRVIRP